jgi:hypothetical protein
MKAPLLVAQTSIEQSAFLVTLVFFFVPDVSLDLRFIQPNSAQAVSRETG